MGFKHSGDISVHMENSGSERRLRGKFLRQVMEKMAVSVAIQCRTQRQACLGHTRFVSIMVLSLCSSQTL